jgi:hypothetical protein
MTEARIQTILRAASVLALAALGMMVWSLFDPRPVPVIAAMSVGQVLGTLSFASFLYVLVADLRRRLRSAGGNAPDERVE